MGSEEVILVDSLTNAAMAGELTNAIRAVTDLPVRWLINTHAHPDHVFTNHLFPGVRTIASHRGRAATRANQGVQARHEAAFACVFSDVDFTGGRYTPQDLAFSGTLSLWQALGQGGREVRVIELGPGHSESDCIVQLLLAVGRPSG